MRIAVALPSLEATAPHRRSLDAMLRHIVDAGHDVEGFAEHDRTEDEGPFTIFHYLRMPERHGEHPFDVGLYPIGRDASPYQGVFSLMHRFPSAVWFLDPIVHHLAVGGVALMDDWVGYRVLLDETYGPTGAALAQTVASNWGTGALFRRYDLVPALAASQRRVLAAWPALAARISDRLDDRPVGVAPLGLVDSALDLPRGEIRRVSIMTINESYATTAVRAAAAAIELSPDISVRVCMSKPIYKAEGARVAAHLGIDDRVDWVFSSLPERLAETAASSDALVWLAEELEGRHRLLLVQGMAEGRVTFVPRTSLYDDIPEGSVVGLALGHTLAPSFGALLRAVVEDRSLRESLVLHGRAFAHACPDTKRAADLLVSELQECAASGPVEMSPVSGPAWAKVDAENIAAATPGGASSEVRRRVAEILRSQTEPFRP